MLNKRDESGCHLKTYLGNLQLLIRHRAIEDRPGDQSRRDFLFVQQCEADILVGVYLAQVDLAILFSDKSDQSRPIGCHPVFFVSLSRLQPKLLELLRLFYSTPHSNTPQRI